MTGIKHFGDVQWDSGQDLPGWNPGRGWRMPSDRGRYITVDDPYWGHVLDNARKAYGDPSIHFDTDNQGQVRHLVFGDGTALPSDGAVVYHDAARRQNWAQNTDGTVSLLGPDGTPQAAISPAGYRRIGDQYAPVTPTGQQVGPQQSGLPASDGGFYTDPKTAVLTPKNANGDYYILATDGKRSYFDRSGIPITEGQFNNVKDPRTGAPNAGLVTAEQQSGKAADAVKKLQDELKQRYTTISSAEEKLSEVLLTAHATTTAGQAKLNDIQATIVAAVENPVMDTTSAAGEKAYLTFLRSQVSAVQDLLSSGSLGAEDQSKAAQALAALYRVDDGATAAAADPATTAPPAAVPTPAPSPAPADPVIPVDPGVASTPGPDPAAMADPGFGLGPVPVMPNPTPALPDLMGTPMSPGATDPMTAMASMLPGALGGIGGLGGLGAGGFPLGGLGGLAGAAGPLADLASGLGTPGGHDRYSAPADAVDTPADKTGPARSADPTTADKTDPAAGKNVAEKNAPAGSADAAAKTDQVDAPPAAAKPDPARTDTTAPPPGAPQPSEGQLPGQAPTAVAPPAAASPTVKLPDGSTSDARTPQSAQAVRDWLAGGTVDTSYQQNGMTLPAVGTPVTNPVPPTQLHCGDVAMFKDHYAPVLSSVKGYLGGAVVPLSQVTSSPDFLGFIDPSAAAASSGHGSPAPPAAPAVPTAPATPPGPLAAEAPAVPAPVRVG